MPTALLMIFGSAASAILCSWAYFRRYAIARPPIGVVNGWDVAVMIGAIVAVPYLYLALPRWLVASMLAAGILSAHSCVWEPLLRTRRATWLAALVCVGAEAGVVWWFGTQSIAFFVVNNAVVTLAIVGITNLWVQSGMKARDLAALAGTLALYDAIATWQLPLMTNLLHRLANLPFAPLVAWPASQSGLWLGIGLGDLLLAAAFPLVLRKAFGRVAGLMALATSLATISALLALAGLWEVRVVFPVMVVLGPLIVLQYGYWRRRQGPERTIRQYRHDCFVLSPHHD